MTAGRVFLLTWAAIVAPWLAPNPVGLALSLAAVALLIYVALRDIGRSRARRQAQREALARQIEQMRRMIGDTGWDHR